MIRQKLVLMIFILILGLYLQLARTVTNKNNHEFRVELVQVLFRHGERTPREKELWPNDPYDISVYEPWGLARLTNQGKMREYRIGQVLRERYDKFLGDIYRPSDVYAFSTDHDRTKTSLQLVLAGLYHPTPAQTWNENLLWVPIPVHYMPEKVDDLMKPDTSSVYLDALDKVRNSEEVLKKVLVYKDLFKFLSEKTGINITKTNQVYEIYNLLVAQKAMNFPSPDWCTDEILKKLQEIVKLEYEIRSYTPQLKRLNGGPLIKRFIENIKINEGRDTPRKIYLYGGHEVNIAGVAKALNFSEPEIPAYGSAIIVEKLSNANGEIYIRMLLWTGVTEELIPYKLAGCEEICPIDRYLSIVKDIIPSDEEANHKWNLISKEELQKLYEEKINFN
ncbi:venom acid phosphatase Acph-1-like isoform X1 [Osmia bicornis bicornis]|uniref:venom acid phosphatase Acph-1-like isoform X1 n=1 Tax=Osmia bicornis bicornis TaxID=1437191 RepID=UPI0010F6CF71|nr:venom acid phosphatase Acph-1-like isoform X1 [Osmia bicornis bicornis]